LLVFPIKSRTDMQTLALTLPSLVLKLFDAAEAIATVQFSRFRGHRDLKEVGNAWR
jgi:hypothetical protein